jgi:hypothetical protein
MNHRAMSVQFHFSQLTLFRVHPENHMGVEWPREIFAELVNFLRGVAFQGFGRCDMAKGDGKFYFTHDVSPSREIYFRANGWRRREEGRIPIASRYFATVRRAMSMESVESTVAIC